MIRIPIERIRRVLALLMLACLFLPLAQCTPKLLPGAKGGPPKPSEFVVAHELHFDTGGDFMLLAIFAWPLPTLALLAWVRARRARIALYVAELLTCSAALYYLSLILMLWGQIRYGGVILLSCMLFYFALTLYCLIWTIRRKVPAGP